MSFSKVVSTSKFLELQFSQKSKETIVSSKVVSTFHFWELQFSQKGKETTGFSKGLSFKVNVSLVRYRAYERPRRARQRE